MQDFQIYGYLFSNLTKDKGKTIAYLHGLTNDNAELLVTPGKKKGEFIVWHRPVPLDLLPAPKPEGEK